MADVKTFLGYLVRRLTDLEIASLAQNPAASSQEGMASTGWRSTASARRVGRRCVKRFFSDAKEMK